MPLLAGLDYQKSRCLTLKTDYYVMVDLRLNSLKIRKVRILEKFCNQCQKLTQKTKFRFFCPRNFRRIAKLNSKFLKIIPIMETIFFSNSSFKTIFSTLRCISRNFVSQQIQPMYNFWPKWPKNEKKRDDPYEWDNSSILNIKS